jgi:hypothetical protein
MVAAKKSLPLRNNLPVTSAKRVFDIESKIRQGEIKVDRKNTAKQQQIAAMPRQAAGQPGFAEEAPDMGTEAVKAAGSGDNDILHPKLGTGSGERPDHAGAKEPAAYVPTENELVQLVKYWYGRRLVDEWDCFYYSMGGGDISLHMCYADFRISLAAEVIGWEAVRQAIAEVREAFPAEVPHRPAIDARLWDIFENGTEEERLAVQYEIYQNLIEHFAAKRAQ